MKMIVTIKPACRSPRSLIRHCFLAVGRQGREAEPLQEDGNRVVGLLNGLECGTITYAPATDARSLCGDVPKSRAPLRHIVISAEDTPSFPKRGTAFEALADVAEQWLEKFAPGSQFIGIMHDDRNHPHIHLLVANNDPFAGDARLSWPKSTLKEMQSFEWVAPATAKKFSIQSGRHVGVTRREGSGMPYPAANLDAEILANATNEQLENYEHQQQLTIGRRNKKGEITSVIFNGRRIRLSTIRQMGQTQKSDLPPGCSAHRNCERPQRQGGAPAPTVRRPRRRKGFDLHVG